MNLHDRAVGENGFELVGRAQSGQTARLDDGEAMAVLRFIEIVRRHEQRDTRVGQLIDQVPEVAS